MATREELREAIDDYVAQAHKSERIKKSLRNWYCNIYVEAVDLNSGITMNIKDTSIDIHDGAYETPDLILRGNSEDLTNIFWCDANPASNYMQGALKIQGSQEDIMRLDTMSLLIYMEVTKQ